MAQLLVVMLVFSKCYAKDVVVLCVVQMHKLLLLMVNCVKIYEVIGILSRSLREDLGLHLHTQRERERERERERA